MRLYVFCAGYYCSICVRADGVLFTDSKVRRNFSDIFRSLHLLQPWLCKKHIWVVLQSVFLCCPSDPYVRNGKSKVNDAVRSTGHSARSLRSVGCFYQHFPEGYCPPTLANYRPQLRSWEKWQHCFCVAGVCFQSSIKKTPQSLIRLICTAYYDTQYLNGLYRSIAQE